MSTAPTRTPGVGWGFVATGSIARTVAADLRLLGPDRLVAASSRDAARAQSFVDECGAPGAVGYGSVEQLVADPRVGIVYVASPHAQHAPAVRLALEAGRAVLCEKAMTLSGADTGGLVQLARDRGVFLMEAVWTRFNPLVTRLRSLVADGAIGTVRQVRADFGFASPYDPGSRLWDPAQGGGSLLDLGIYPVQFAQMLLGTPDRVEAAGTLSPDGVDEQAALLLQHPGGASALLGCSLVSPLAVVASVAGTTGRFDVSEPFFSPTSATVSRDGAEPETLTAELEGSGYVPELREVERCVAEGLLESPGMTLDDSLAIAGVLDAALAAIGVRYP